MCVSVYSSLLLFTITIFFIFSTGMVTEGRPMARQEPGSDRGLLTGADFLSVFMGSSSVRQAHLETSTSIGITTTKEDAPPEITSTEAGSTTYYSELENLKTAPVEASTEAKENLEIQTATVTDQSFLASEEQPSIIAEANKSEFSVEESEPITTNNFGHGYPASVQAIPNPSLLHDSVQPIHQTVIYHNNPRQPGHARSVSYSTVIQAAAQPHLEKTLPDNSHDRHERHYDNTRTPAENLFDNSNVNKTKPHWQNDGITTEKNWGIPEKNYGSPNLPTIYGKPEQNYEVDESASVMTNGRSHGIQPSPTSAPKLEVKIGESRKTDDNQKVGYVVEGRNYRKYRVEERTSDGFIVGEYGVVSHDDGSLRGVRYTADGTTSPRLIYDALMKFLSL